MPKRDFNKVALDLPTEKKSSLVRFKDFLFIEYYYILLYYIKLYYVASYCIILIQVLS